MRCKTSDCLSVQFTPSSVSGRYPDVRPDTSSCHCTLASISTDSWRRVHPVKACNPKVCKHVRFIRASALEHLPQPWPRCQDLRNDLFKEPTVGDVVVAVSHGWPYQVHPDPLGEKLGPIKQLLQQVCVMLKVHVRQILLFIDFLCIPQQPFKHGQVARSREEQDTFSSALQLMHLVFQYADVVLHLDIPLSDVPGDGLEREVKATDLTQECAQFWQAGAEVQVHPSSSSKSTAPFDTIIEMDGEPVASKERLELILRGPNPPDTVKVKHAPFGRQNRTPCCDRGWIFLERFLTIVKVAMVDEYDVRRIAFSNSAEVFRQLHEGGEKIRLAAKCGHNKMREVFKAFALELARKSFSGTSSDALAADGKLLETTSDAEAVLRLMEEATQALPQFWQEKVMAQRARQLILGRQAVSMEDLPIADSWMGYCSSTLSSDSESSSHPGHGRVRERKLSMVSVATTGHLPDTIPDDASLPQMCQLRRACRRISHTWPSSRSSRSSSGVSGTDRSLVMGPMNCFPSATLDSMPSLDEVFSDDDGDDEDNCLPRPRVAWPGFTSDSLPCARVA